MRRPRIGGAGPIEAKAASEAVVGTGAGMLDRGSAGNAHRHRHRRCDVRPRSRDGGCAVSATPSMCAAVAELLAARIVDLLDRHFAIV